MGDGGEKAGSSHLPLPTMIKELNLRIKNQTTNKQTKTQGCIPKRLPGRPDEALDGGKQGPSAPGWARQHHGSPPGSPVPGILQARTLEWVAISFSNA